jgi:GR25 family glycosyltransferase involved in LPS biosynthesis
MARDKRAAKTRKLKRGKGYATGLQSLDIFHTPVYVINLKKRADRWKVFMEQDPGVRALQIRRVDAVNGKALNYLTDKRIAPSARLNIMRNDRRIHREVATLGAVGCSMSHAKVWQRIVDSEAPYAVIMEDDARLTMDQLQKINQLAKTIPADTGIWLFGVYRPNMIHEPLPNGSPWSRVHAFTASHAYVITRATAQKFLEQVYPIEMHIDHYMSTMSVLYDIPMLLHKDLFIPFGGILNTGSKTTAVDSATSQHIKDACSACHVPDHLSRFFRRVGPKTRRGRLVRGILRPKLDRKVRTYRAARVPIGAVQGGGEEIIG